MTWLYVMGYAVAAVALGFVVYRSIRPRRSLAQARTRIVSEYLGDGCWNDTGIDE